MLRADGRVIFWTMPDEKFRYSITSDALETKIVLENRTSKQKWYEFKGAIGQQVNN